MHFLGIEIGRTAVRVTALDLESARVAATATSTLPGAGGQRGGLREADPAAWITATGHAMQAVLGELGSAKDAVAAVSVTAPPGGMVAVDARDQVVRPALVAGGRSASRQAESIARAFGGAPGLTELCGNAPGTGSLAAQCLWLKEEEPYHFLRTARIMTSQDFIGYWLTGEAGTEAGTAATTGLLDIPVRNWCQELVEFIDPRLADLLPPLLLPAQPLGVLRPALCEAWGLPEGVLVAPGSGSTALSVLAAGAAAGGDMVAELSRDGWLAALSERPVIDFPGEASALCDATGRWLSCVGMAGAMQARESIRQHYGWDSAELEKQSHAAPPGAQGLMLLPCRGKDDPSCFLEGAGALYGITAGNFTPQNFARAAEECLALGFGSALGRLRNLGFRPGPVRISRNSGPGFRQLLADVSGVPVTTVSGEGGAAVGAAMQAAVVCFRQSGESMDFAQIASYLVAADSGSCSEPDPHRHGFYQELVARQQTLAGTPGGREFP